MPEDCPCKHVVEISARADSKSELLRSDLDHLRKETAFEAKQLLSDFQEMNLQVKECLLNMQQSAVMFADGSAKFRQIEERVKTLEHYNEEVEAAIGEELPVLVKRWMPRKKYVALWAVVVSISLLVSGHAAEAWALLKGIF